MPLVHGTLTPASRHPPFRYRRSKQPLRRLARSWTLPSRSPPTALIEDDFKRGQDPTIDLNRSRPDTATTPTCAPSRSRRGGFGKIYGHSGDGRPARSYHHHHTTPRLVCASTLRPHPREPRGRHISGHNCRPAPLRQPRDIPTTRSCSSSRIFHLRRPFSTSDRTLTIRREGRRKEWGGACLGVPMKCDGRAHANGISQGGEEGERGGAVGDHAVGRGRIECFADGEGTVRGEKYRRASQIADE